MDLSRTRQETEEGESAFVSMTDLTVSFLFIILILLAFFSTQINPTEQGRIDQLADYLDEASKARTLLLEELVDQIQAQVPGIHVTVVAADGVIRFRGDDLFESGEWRVVPDSTADLVAKAVGDAFAHALPCFTVGSMARFNPRCNSSFALIETIQIEGHTDDLPLSQMLKAREKMLDNRDLSARRGAETLRAITNRYKPELMDFLNLRDQPVLSFAGYGAMRPIVEGDTSQARAANRRIDIRFILQTPQNLKEVQEIRDSLLSSNNRLPSIID